jgi:phytoene dehydrogenase-like protein
MDEAYDIVVIGGGHNGLAAALKLKAAGLSVCVLEAEAECGGWAATTDALLAGVRHSPHANTLMFADLMPAEISPRALGVRTQQPEAQLGVAFSDGRPPVIISRCDRTEKTRKSLSVYSEADASTYVALKQSADTLGPLIQAGLYAPPTRAWFAEQAEAVRLAFKSVIGAAPMGQGAVRALVDRLFEAPEVRLLMYCLALETGVGLEDEGGELAFLGYSLWIAGRWGIVEGGMGAYSKALSDAVESHGVVIARTQRVTHLIVENESARGAVTAEGMAIRASRAVLAGIPLLEAMALVDDAVIPARQRRDLATFAAGRANSIAGSFFRLRSAPRYKSARHDAAIDRCLKTIVGHDTPEDALTQAHDLAHGLLPRPAGVVRVHSLFDDALAPQGEHIAGVDSAFPAAACLDAKMWRAVEASFPEGFVEVWRRACEDDRIDVAAMGCNATARFERRMLLRLGADQYRSGVEGFYLGGPGMYPGGGVHGACGLGAAQVMLADLGVGQ